MSAANSVFRFATAAPDLRVRNAALVQRVDLLGRHVVHIKEAGGGCYYTLAARLCQGVEQPDQDATEGGDCGDTDADLLATR
jgi:hypothetical protein